MDLSIYPISFFVSALALIPSGLFAWKHRRHGWGLPMLAVLGTTAVWYHGDGLYNDYEEYRTRIGDDALSAAWWQVLLFTVTFAFLVQPIHQHINRKFLKRRSYMMLYAETGKIKLPAVQKKIDELGVAMLTVWLVLMSIALVRLDYDFTSLFATYLTEKKNPWLRGRMGGGISALLSMAGYVQILMTAGFGVIAAVSNNPKTKTMAITVCCLAFPFYIFDRTRNTMIATMLPGLLAWVFFALQGGVWKKTAILAVAFLVVNFWFGFVLENRGGDISEAYRKDKSEMAEEEDGGGKHEGLSMFSELAYINDFFEQGTYSPTWGGRYFAEVANVVPRGIWKNKPTIGLDYAIARGFQTVAANVHHANVTTSVSTGMIGQGAVNFGRFFGPMAAALLMALWVSILARQDLMGGEPARLLLCSVGMILTFNMGRDITLLVLYPYVFGWILILIMEWNKKKKREQNVSAPIRRQGQSPPR